LAKQGLVDGRPAVDDGLPSTDERPGPVLG
jgi:hypothetical protein